MSPESGFDPVQAGDGAPPLVAEGLRKTYRGADRPALAGVDLSVEKGEIFGLLGPNGAGKTTAISIMSSLMRPDRGRVAICGIDVFGQPRRARRRFGLVPQEIALYEGLTVRENLIYFGRLCGLKGQGLKDRVSACLDLAGLSEKADHRIATFSGGMKRRANLVAGIIHTPRLVFLDEPTVGIDAQSRQMILDRLSELSREGMSMIYTTHYMEEAEALCTRVAVIDEGRIIARGKPADLIGAREGCKNLGDLFIRLTGKRLRDG